SGTRQTCRARADYSNRLSISLAFRKDLFAVCESMIGSITLQPADLDRFVEQRFFNTRAFTQNFDRTYARAGCADGVCVKYDACRARKIAARDLFDKTRHVDMRRARVHARRVITIETSICLMLGLGRRQCRIDVGKVLLDLLDVERCAVRITHVIDGPSQL